MNSFYSLLQMYGAIICKNMMFKRISVTTFLQTFPKRKQTIDKHGNRKWLLWRHTEQFLWWQCTFCNFYITYSQNNARQTLKSSLRTILLYFGWYFYTAKYLYENYIAVFHKLLVRLNLNLGAEDYIASWLFITQLKAVLINLIPSRATTQTFIQEHSRSSIQYFSALSINFFSSVILEPFVLSRLISSLYIVPKNRWLFDPF